MAFALSLVSRNFKARWESLTSSVVIFRIVKLLQLSLRLYVWGVNQSFCIFKGWNGAALVRMT